MRGLRGIGTRTSKASGGAPIQIHAQALRQRGDEPSLGALPGVTMKFGGHGTPPKGHWRQADVKRAIAAAEQAGLESYRIELFGDGTIAIVVGNPADTAPEPGLYSDLKGS